MLKLVIVFSLVLSFQTHAHPVIYQDGWALSSSNMPTYSNNYLMYSVTNRWALGMDHWRFTQDSQHTEAGLAKLNYLLWRRNTLDSQANIYLHGGAGAIKPAWGPSGTHALYMTGVEADWETRTLYTSLKHLQFHAPSRLDLSMTQARVGFSPIVADFGSLQSWFMLQAMHIRDVEEKLVITPMLRFFYHNVLWEFGSSTRGDWMLNLMVHY